jgi:hypothetical protein
VAKVGLAPLQVAIVAHDTASSLSLKLFEEAFHASVVFLNLIEAIFKFDFFIEQVFEFLYFDLKDRGDFNFTLVFGNSDLCHCWLIWGLQMLSRMQAF